jgi:L-amino acid N-acyltransferase YncA
VRRAEPGDARALAAIYAPMVESTAISFEESAPDAAEMARRIATIGAAFPWLVAEVEGIAGYAYASPHRARPGYRWSVDVSVYVRPEAQRSGIARRLYAGLFRALEAQHYYTAFAGVSLPNAASVALHRSAGFEDVGVYRNVGYKAGAWRDVLWLARPLRPATSAPREPLRLDDLPATALAALLAAL